MAITLIVSCFCFAVSTLAYREILTAFMLEPHDDVVRYGFPLGWLEETTASMPLPPQYSPTHYNIIWLGLFADVVSWMSLALNVSFATARFMQRGTLEE